MSKQSSTTMSRRSFLKKFGFGLLGLSAAASYPFVAERFWYQIKEVHLPLAKLPHSFEGWKIVQLSDIHLGFYFGTKELQNLFQKVNELHPDMVIFTGDLVDRSWTNVASAMDALSILRTPRGGKWAVLGNHDVMSKKEVIDLLQAGDFTVLQNSSGYIRLNNQRLYVAGVNDALLDHWDIDKAVKGINEGNCILLLAHEPDLADISWKHGISAQFSGHSHGGQVRVPMIGPLFTPDLAVHYVDGLYEVGDSKMPLYVNRGIGCSHLPIRFCCRPEITVFHLQRK